MFYHVFQCLSIVIEQKGMIPVLPREILTPQIYKKTNTVVFFRKKNKYLLIFNKLWKKNE